MLSLGEWTPHIQSQFPELEPTRGLRGSRLQGYHLLWPGFPSRSLVTPLHPRSLAATDGVAVAFLSCSYLDVSVHCVRSIPPMHSAAGDLMVGFPHSEIQRSQPGYRLLLAYRRFPRPSSPLDTKTSTVRPCGSTANPSPRSFDPDSGLTQPT